MARFTLTEAHRDALRRLAAAANALAEKGSVDTGPGGDEPNAFGRAILATREELLYFAQATPIPASGPRPAPLPPHVVS